MTLPIRPRPSCPALALAQTFRVDMPLTISTGYAEIHRIELSVDPDGLILETSPSNNQLTVEYVLAQGSCP